MKEYLNEEIFKWVVYVNVVQAELWAPELVCVGIPDQKDWDGVKMACFNKSFTKKKQQCVC